MNFIYIDVLGDLFCGSFIVARQHDGFPDAGLFQSGDRLFRMLFQFIRNDDVSGVLTVDRHMDDGADAVAVQERDAQARHEAVVAGGDLVSVHHRGDAVAADLLHVRDQGRVEFFAVSCQDALRNGVRRVTLRVRGQPEEFLVFEFAVVDAGDREVPAGQRAGLVEDDRLDVGEGLHVVGALDEDARVGRAADAAEEAQGHGDDDGAGTADDEEGERPVDPLGPERVEVHRETDQRRGERQKHGGCNDGGRIVLRELRDEVLRFRFAGTGVLHEFKDLGRRGLAEGLRGADFQDAGEVDAAGVDGAVRADVHRQRLAGQSAVVEARLALDDDAVDRDAFAGLHHDDRAGFERVRVHLHEFSVFLDVRVVRADIHEVRNVLAALPDGDRLEQFADLVEQHDRDALRVLLKDDGADGGKGHQEVLVEHLATADALDGLP